MWLAAHGRGHFLGQIDADEAIGREWGPSTRGEQGTAII
jgi:hypothetical protein